MVPVRTYSKKKYRRWVGPVCLGTIAGIVLYVFIVAHSMEDAELRTLTAYTPGTPFAVVRGKHGDPEQIIADLQSWEWLGIPQDAAPRGTDRIAIYGVVTKAVAFFLDADGMILEARTLRSD